MFYVYNIMVPAKFSPDFLVHYFIIYNISSCLCSELCNKYPAVLLTNILGNLQNLISLFPVVVKVCENKSATELTVFC